jgi:hypothetical protein
MLVRQEFGLTIEFIKRLQFVTTNNYNTLTNLRTLQITTPYTKFSLSSLVVAWWRHLTMQLKTGGLPIRSSWRQALWGLRTAIFLQLNYRGPSPYVTSFLTR